MATGATSTYRAAANIDPRYRSWLRFMQQAQAAWPGVQAAQAVQREKEAYAAYGEPAARVDTQQPDPWSFLRRRKKSGYSSTILAGELVPMDTGKRTILG